MAGQQQGQGQGNQGGGKGGEKKPPPKPTASLSAETPRRLDPITFGIRVAAHFQKGEIPLDGNVRFYVNGTAQGDERTLTPTGRCDTLVTVPPTAKIVLIEAELVGSAVRASTTVAMPKDDTPRPTGWETPEDAVDDGGRWSGRVKVFDDETKRPCPNARVIFSSADHPDQEQVRLTNAGGMTELFSWTLPPGVEKEDWTLTVEGGARLTKKITLRRPRPKTPAPKPYPGRRQGEGWFSLTLICRTINAALGKEE